MDFDVKNHSGVLSIKWLNADHLDMYNILQYWEFVNKEIEKSDSTKIVLDLEEIPFMDSSAIGMFIKMNRKLKLNDKVLMIKNVSQSIQDVLKLSGIEHYLEILE